MARSEAVTTTASTLTPDQSTTSLTAPTNFRATSDCLNAEPNRPALLELSFHRSDGTMDDFTDVKRVAQEAGITDYVPRSADDWDGYLYAPGTVRSLTRAGTDAIRNVPSPTAAYVVCERYTLLTGVIAVITRQGIDIRERATTLGASATIDKEFMPSAKARGWTYWTVSATPARAIEVALDIAHQQGVLAVHPTGGCPGTGGGPTPFCGIRLK